MAAVVNNYAKGRGNEFVNRVVNNDPANSAIVIVMLKTAETNAALQDYASLGAALAAGGGTECSMWALGRRDRVLSVESRAG